MPTPVLRLVTAVFAALLFAAPAAAEDKIVGAVWDMQFKEGKDNWVSRFKFRATQEGKVFHDAKEVGTHKRTGDDIEMSITGMGPRLNGEYKFLKVRKDEKGWAGTLTRSNPPKNLAAEASVRIKMVKD